MTVVLTVRVIVCYVRMDWKIVCMFFSTALTASYAVSKLIFGARFIPLLSEPHVSSMIVNFF